MAKGAVRRRTDTVSNPPLFAAGLIDRLNLMTFPLPSGGGTCIADESAKPGALKPVDRFG